MAARCDQNGLQWCWGRIFYPYGEGQNPNSLLPSLQHALEAGEPSFAMSSGRQIRDFVHVDTIATMLLLLASHPNACGVYNCGSGKPNSLREIAEQTIKRSSSQIKLELGKHPDRQDEPLAFWADTNKIASLQK
jgi:dTDP-6-deoxy-L-talose 4-dehydrogenase (NAD+)